MGRNKKDIAGEPAREIIPKTGKTYWYVRSSMVSHHYNVYESKWMGYDTDLFRLVQGNVFLTENEAINAAEQMNDRLYDIRLASLESRQEELAESDRQRKKAEAAERRKQRKQLTQKEKAQQYESGKKKRTKRGGDRPDVID